MRKLLWIIAVALAGTALPCRAAFSITATPTELKFQFDGRDALRLVEEVAPYDDGTTNVLGTFLAPLDTLSVPRFDGARDRLYSGFFARHGEQNAGPMRFASAGRRISRYHPAYPHTRSKKGLQVQMVDDAIALGVQHAALNFDFQAAAKPVPGGNDVHWKSNGRDFWFDGGYMNALDNQIKPLSDSGAAVTLILVNWVHPGTAADAILRHPHYDTNCPEHLSAFNASTADGVAWFVAMAEFLTSRYSQPGFPHGRVVNFIVGNEVNSHWYWANMGRVSMRQFARDYSRTVRLCDLAVRKYSATDRVFISLEHDWNIRYSALSPTQGFAGRPFLDYFATVGKEGGDFDWNVAYHPYPENLFDCRTWLDKQAAPTPESPMITFRNIEVLPQYLRRPEMRFDGAPRHVILSEQGFNSKGDATIERLQAAAFCYAWEKIVHLNGVDAFILHRHVDHRDEGGLNLGLWRRDPHSPQPSQPLSRKPIYDVFRAADTPRWRAAFAFALPIIGIRSWNEVQH